MKPQEAADYLRNLVKFVSTDERMPNHIKTWFCVAARACLSGSEKRLDQLLELRSRNGGRMTLGCRIPARDDMIRALAETLDLPGVKAKAEEIERRAKAGELSKIQAIGRIPGVRQLENIIGK